MPKVFYFVIVWTIISIVLSSPIFWKNLNRKDYNKLSLYILLFSVIPNSLFILYIYYIHKLYEKTNVVPMEDIPNHYVLKYYYSELLLSGVNFVMV